jgi:hypothetical protein
MIVRLLAALRIEFPPLPYCARCGGHYPPHSH